MNKLTTIILAVLGGCSVVIDIMTPIAIVLFWGWRFDFDNWFMIVIIVVGGLATLFRAIKIGFMRK